MALETAARAGLQVVGATDARIAELEEQLRLANIDAANELAENTRLRAALGETE